MKLFACLAPIARALPALPGSATAAERRGMVLGPDDVPLAGAEALLLSAAGTALLMSGMPARATLGRGLAVQAGGRFSAAGIVEGRYRVQPCIAVGASAALQPGAAVVVAGKETKLQVAASPWGTVSGRVSDAGSATARAEQPHRASDRSHRCGSEMAGSIQRAMSTSLEGRTRPCARDPNRKAALASGLPARKRAGAGRACSRSKGCSSFLARSRSSRFMLASGTTIRHIGRSVKRGERPAEGELKA